ncbi:GNAT family N-acetyltransferase [Roseibium aggregatum]|uniref:GNAT family N-acetyltransferase n=1 Tax=Roseibium aggregatum TaxID=187304 RepID=UPI0002EA9D3D|nr:GNAT family N-acetyltransferase [Roseibium aggregatum]
MTKTSAQPAIRRAKLQDAPRLKACIDAAYAPVKSTLPDLPDVSAGIAADISQNHVFVAEFADRIIGCAILGLSGTSAHLMNLAVDPDVKGRGVGRRLIEAAEAFAGKNGARAMHLATHIGMPENIALYTHLGWSEMERNGNKVLMSKDL